MFVILCQESRSEKVKGDEKNEVVTGGGEVRFVEPVVMERRQIKYLQLSELRVYAAAWPVMA